MSEKTDWEAVVEWEFRLHGGLVVKENQAADPCRTVYAGLRDTIYAFDIETGEPRWKHVAPSTVWRVESNDRIVVVNTRDSVLVLDATTGDLIPLDIDKGPGDAYLASTELGDRIFYSKHGKLAYHDVTEKKEQVLPVEYDGGRLLCDGKRVLYSFQRRVYKLLSFDPFTAQPRALLVDDQHGQPSFQKDDQLDGPFGPMGGSWQAQAVDLADGSVLWREAYGSDYEWNEPMISDGLILIGATDWRDLWDISGRYRDAREPEKAEKVLFAIDASNGKPRWEFRRQLSWAPDWTRPVVAEGSVIAALNQTVFRLGLEDGNPIWEFVATQGQIRATPVVLNGVIYVTDDVEVRRLDLRKGYRTGKGDKFSCSIPGTERISRPRQAKPAQIQFKKSGRIVVISTDDNIEGYRLISVVDPQALDVVWQEDSGGTIPHSSSVTATSPLLLVTPSLVFVGCDDGIVYAINRNTGQEVWFTRLSGPVAFLLVADQTLYALAEHSEICALDASTGELVWRRAINAEAPLVQEGNVLCVLSQEDPRSGRWAVTALARLNGKTLWKWRPSFWERLLGFYSYRHSLASAGGRVFVTSKRSRRLYAIDAITGKTMWPQSIHKLDPEKDHWHWQAQILATEQRVSVVGKSDIQTMDTASGTIVWEHSGDYWWYPVLFGGVLYLTHDKAGDGIHSLVVLDFETGDEKPWKDVSWGTRGRVVAVTESAVYVGYGGVGYPAWLADHDPADGTRRKLLEVEGGLGPYLYQAVVIDHYVYCASRDGMVWAIPLSAFEVVPKEDPFTWRSW